MKNNNNSAIGLQVIYNLHALTYISNMINCWVIINQNRRGRGYLIGFNFEHYLCVKQYYACSYSLCIRIMSVGYHLFRHPLCPVF